MSSLDAVTAIATQIGAALEPMAGAFRSQPTFAALMEKLGWSIDTVPAALAPLSAPADQVAAAMESIKQASLQNAAGTKQAEAAARSLHDLGQKLRRLIEQYKV